MKLHIMLSVLLCTGGLYGSNKELYTKYLNTTGLSAAECVERSPSDLFGWLRQEKNLEYGGTISQEQAVIELFYATYFKALSQHLDATAANITASRDELQTILHLISDFYRTVSKSRSFVTHQRLDAYGEFLLSSFADQSNSLIHGSTYINPSLNEAIRFIIIKSMLYTDFYDMTMKAKFDKFANELRVAMENFENSLPTVDAAEFRFTIMHFAENHGELMYP